MAALATYRLANLITIDDGPFRIFQRVRIRAGTYDRNNRGEPMTLLGQLFGCPYCMALYVALPVAVLALLPTVAGDVFLAWMALAGFQDAVQGPRHPR